MVRKGFSPFLTVFTRADHDTTTGVRFFPFTPPRSTADVKAIRALLDVMNITGNMHIQFGYIQSDESEIFAGPATVLDAGYSRTTDGCSGTDGYIAVTLTKTWVVFGIIVRNNTNSNLRIESAWASTRFDTRAC